MATRNPPVAPVGDYTPFHINQAQAVAAPIGQPINTTSNTAITGAGSAAITPVDASVIGKMRVGMPLVIAGDGSHGTAEEVFITAIDPVAGTFTAVFANTHTAGYSVRSRRGVNIGSVIIGKAGTTTELFLYNGEPNISYSSPPEGYGLFADIVIAGVAALPYNLSCDYGLYYRYTVSAAGDLCIGYKAQPW